MHPGEVPLFTADAEERLDRFLARKMPDHSRTRLARIADEGGVHVDGISRPPGFKLKPGMVVDLEDPAPTPPHDLAPSMVPFGVAYEDEAVLVVDKPRGLAVHPAPGQRDPTLVHALLARHTPLSSTAGAFRPGIVHRLDMDTTGLLMVAKDDASHRHLAAQIQRRTAGRRYLALLRGRPELERFRIEAPIGRHPTNRRLMAVVAGGKMAATEFAVLRAAGSGTLVGCRLLTGRTHQIRVHAAAYGMPVEGDPLYLPPRPVDPPLRLHAAYLAFDHPRSGRRIVLTAEPPEDFPEARFDDPARLVGLWTDAAPPSAAVTPTDGV